jgi:ABC-type phosphate/phosphonate transport system substrate-binding protein
VTVRRDLPADMKRDIQRLFVDLQTIDPKLAEIVARGKTQGYVPVTHDMYKPVLDAVQEQRRMRRKG